jgi:AhpD family alkylhydroperoxidase
MPSNSHFISRRAAIIGSLIAPVVARAATNGAASPLSVAALEQQAQKRVAAKARVTLVEPSSRLFAGIDSLEPAGSGLVPNYVRAIATLPKMARPMAHLFKTFISDGALPSETKLAMALRIAQVNSSPYTAAHVERLLRATERGKIVLAALKSNQTGTLTAAEQRALAWAEESSQHVDALSDAEFQTARGSFNDAQVVEIAFTSCFFNYFTRFTEALNLPVESWVGGTSPAPLKTVPPDPARVSLVSDEEMRATEAAIAASKNASSPNASWNIGIANSQRAMLHAPAMYAAWRQFGTAAQEYASVSREIKLQVSFAVSTANGCRYCTIHQVLGLRRLGVSPSKLMAMQKDDSALSPEELAAVVFARKLTAEPGNTTDDDYQRLRTTFKEQGAIEVLMQTCNFAFMNRFTDGLRLPSEDEAVKVYRETYGTDWQRKKK